ncbi:MAG: hypothetical protein ACE5LU_10250 [Anaerolineae bacterium]
MKKRLAIALILGLLLVLAIAGAVLAEGGIDLQHLSGSGWWVSWQVQNVGTQTANLQVQVISADGEPPHTSSATTQLDPGEAVSFVPGKPDPGLQPPLPEGFIGSAVLSADQPIVAIGNVANNPLPSFGLGVQGGVAAGQYQGVSGDDAATEVLFPLLKNDFAGQTTTFYVQAAGQAASVTMTYKTNDGKTYTDGPYSLNADVMHVFSPDSVSGLPKSCPGPSSTATCVGSAVATSSSGPIAGVYAEHPTTGDPASFVLSSRGFTPKDADTIAAAPVIKNEWSGRTTALTVQNAETSADVTVNVTFTGNKGACAGQSYSGTQYTLAPGESKIWFPNLGNVGGMPANCFAAAKVTAEGGKVVAIVNESGGAKKTVYSAFGVTNATRNTALPLVKEFFNKRTTGVVIQNTGEAATDVTVEYNVVGGSPVSLPTFSIPAGQSVSLFQISRRPGVWGPAVTQLDGTNNGVMIRSTSENVVAIAQESGTTEEVDIKNYEGFNTQ